MRIAALAVHPVAIPLSRPYAVATYSCDRADLVWVELRLDDGTTGLGAATPEPEVNGETAESCAAALREAVRWLPGLSCDVPTQLAATFATRFPRARGAAAALDMALHDAWAKSRGLPLADALGRAHDELPTSITIGVRDVPQTLAEADEYLGRGFRVLKIKIGADLELDLERLVRLRERLGPGVPLLVDGNVGYTWPQLVTFLDRTRGLGIDLIEQPLRPDDVAPQSGLPAADLARLVADESLHGPGDAVRLATPPRAFGVWNIKLMKCGGISPARSIAARAAASGVELMWGCMDESAIGIAAALHTAFSCPATRYLDLDGSFDLARDVVRGGFELRDGRMRTAAAAGLGVEKV